jgi:glycine oxidase
LDSKAIRSLSPIVGEQVQRAFYEPHLLQVRTPRLMRALVAAAHQSKVTISAHDPVLGFVAEADRVLGVNAVSGRFLAGEVVLAAGAHAGDLARRELGLKLPIRPVRGQIALLEGLPVSKSPLLLGTSGRYLIPRSDGRILAGSTFETVGFDRRVTASGIHDILAGALRLAAPALGQARLTSSWAGLRPESPDRLPYLGRVSGLSGLVVAAGHFRDGILLTPVTAEIVSEIVLGRTSSIDLTPFMPARTLPEWSN